jgi:hypothetical protein
MPQTTVCTEVEVKSSLSEDSVNRFVLTNFEEITNRIILSYQSVTGEIDNAGFINPIGMSDIQLFATILVDGRDIRDRYPFSSLNTRSLDLTQLAEWRLRMVDSEQLPLAIIFLTHGRLSLERGQYASAVIQCATAVELRTTQTVRGLLNTAGWTDKAIGEYERLTLGQKLGIPKTDTRSLETYLDGVPGFAEAFDSAKRDLVPLRNKVVHKGYLPWNDESLRALNIAVDFLRVVR